MGHDLDDDELKATRKRLENNVVSVGDYVRTIKGDICKVLDVRKQSKFKSSGGYWCVSPERYFLDNTKIHSISKPYIKKHSKNIIDLIEEGDYINGLLITAIYDEYKEDEYIKFETNYEGKYRGYTDGDIKSIVTKEQFSQIEYKVEE